MWRYETTAMWCLPDTALVGALAMETTPNKAVVFLVYDGQDGPDSGSEEELTRPPTSLRVPDKDKITTTVVTPTPRTGRSPEVQPAR